MTRIITVCLLACFVGLVSAQEYKSRVPRPSDQLKIAGVSDYIQDGPRANFTLYHPGEAEVYILQPTNNVIAFKSLSELTNAQVFLPDPSTSPRQSFLINVNGNVSVEVIPVGGYVLTTATNVAPLESIVTATNCSFWMFNNNRTAWHFVPIH